MHRCSVCSAAASQTWAVGVAMDHFAGQHKNDVRRFDSCLTYVYPLPRHDCHWHQSLTHRVVSSAEAEGYSLVGQPEVQVAEV